MIIPDTTLISELLTRPEAWLSSSGCRCGTLSVFTTAVTEAKTLCKITLLPDVHRRRDMDAAISPIYGQDQLHVGCRLIATQWISIPSIATDRRCAGRPAKQLDAQIASIALSRGASVATRNVSDLEGIGLALVSPWKDH